LVSQYNPQHSALVSQAFVSVKDWSTWKGKGKGKGKCGFV